MHNREILDQQMKNKMILSCLYSSLLYDTTVAHSSKEEVQQCMSLQPPTDVYNISSQFTIIIFLDDNTHID